MLKKFRKETPIKFSRRKSVKDHETGNVIDGRYVVTDKKNKIDYYSTTIEHARMRRRDLILKALEDYRYRTGTMTKIIE